MDGEPEANLDVLHTEGELGLEMGDVDKTLKVGGTLTESEKFQLWSPGQPALHGPPCSLFFSLVFKSLHQK